MILQRLSGQHDPENAVDETCSALLGSRYSNTIQAARSRYRARRRCSVLLQHDQATRDRDIEPATLLGVTPTRSDHRDRDIDLDWIERRRSYEQAIHVPSLGCAISTTQERTSVRSSRSVLGRRKIARTLSNSFNHSFNHRHHRRATLDQWVWSQYCDVFAGTVRGTSKVICAVKRRSRLGQPREASSRRVTLLRGDSLPEAPR